MVKGKIGNQNIKLALQSLSSTPLLNLSNLGKLKIRGYKFLKSL